MLMKRMDLTVQSFLWSEKAQGCAEQIRQQVQARQRHLAVMPARYLVHYLWNNISMYLGV